MIRIADKLAPWHKQVALGQTPMNVAVSGTWFCFAQQIFNYVVSKQNQVQSVSSTPTIFTDALYFSLRGSPIPLPIPTIAMQHESVSPLFNDFSSLVRAFDNDFITTKTNPIDASVDTYQDLFKAIFEKWLGYKLEIPIGQQVGNLAVTNPSTYTTQFIFDAQQTHLIEYPKVVGLPNGYATSKQFPYLFKDTFTTQNAIQVRPFLGLNTIVTWNPSTIMSIATTCAMEIMNGNALNQTKEYFVNPLDTLEKYIIKALNTNITTFSPTTSFVYGVPSCPMIAPTALTHTIKWN